jgi:hypothetical protein
MKGSATLAAIAVSGLLIATATGFVLTQDTSKKIEEIEEETNSENNETLETDSIKESNQSEISEDTGKNNSGTEKNSGNKNETAQNNSTVLEQDSKNKPPELTDINFGRQNNQTYGYLYFSEVSEGESNCSLKLVNTGETLNCSPSNDENRKKLLWPVKFNSNGNSPLTSKYWINISKNKSSRKYIVRGAKIFERSEFNSDPIEYENPDILIVSYGFDSENYRSEDIKDKIDSGFKSATEGITELNISYVGHLEAVKHDTENVSDDINFMRERDYPHEDDKYRLWYYYNGKSEITKEVRKKLGEKRGIPVETDIILIVTDLEFNGKGFYLGPSPDAESVYARIVVGDLLFGNWVEGRDSVRRINQSTEGIADTAIHEIGHFYGLRHHRRGEKCMMNPVREVEGIHSFCQQSLEKIRDKVE